MANRLALEKSPYLLQHAENPIDWYPWGNEAFETAQKLHRPIFLSIGYSTCHWCHVMEHESFTKSEVAEVLNTHFVSIKVDREEHPDVDSHFMEVVQGIHGSGGWPMTVFLTPDGEPFFGGTYFHRNHFLSLLDQIQKAWQSQPGAVRADGQRVLEWMKLNRGDTSASSSDERILGEFLNRFEEQFDAIHGGRIGAPKFPPSSALRLLLRIFRRSNQAHVLKMVTTTLDHMACGGIYDHIGGGFHRYSTDDAWGIPHFEKMLYDQASLLSTYLEGYQVTKNPEYARVAEEIAQYVFRDLTSTFGGFFAAEDADSAPAEDPSGKKEEGLFYAWKEQELRAVLSKDEWEVLQRDFELTPNFEGHWIVPIRKSLGSGNHSSENHKTRSLILKKLFEKRSLKPRPHRDEKILVCWNGLMISALARAATALEKPQFLEKAMSAARFILENVRDENGKLTRTWIDHTVNAPAQLEDYAFFIESLIEIYLATRKPIWIEHALRLQEEADPLFWDQSSHLYFSNPENRLAHIGRRKDFEDHVVPSGASVALWNLMRLSALGTYHGPVPSKKAVELKNRSSQMLHHLPSQLSRIPLAFPHWLMALDYGWDFSPVVHVKSLPSEGFREIEKDGFFPNRMVVADHGGDGDPTQFQICAMGSCFPPGATLEDALKKTGQTDFIKPLRL